MITKNPNDKILKTKPAEIVRFESKETKPVEKAAPLVEKSTRNKKDIENEAIVLCLKIVRGEDCFDDLLQVLKVRESTILFDSPTV
jgi:hypothetical protein